MDWVAVMVGGMCALAYAVGLIHGGSMERHKATPAASWKHLALLAANECIRLREKHEPDAATPPHKDTDRCAESRA
jgi:hypothetical protein